MQPQTPTLRYEKETWSVEIPVADQLVVVTQKDLRVWTGQRLEIIEWADLLEIISDLAHEPAETDAPPVIIDPLTWLANQPGVQRAPRANGRHGFLLTDDCDAEGTTYTA